MILRGFFCKMISRGDGMVIYKQGDLFQDDAEAFVNAVNVVGVMGAGIALQFKKRYPDMFEAYEKACSDGELQLGKMHVYEREKDDRKYIINFPTLHHYRDKSKLSDIEAGLQDLVEVVKKHNIQSIAIPPLGCGAGGLAWEDVKQLTDEAFSKEDITVHLYEPM